MAYHLTSAITLWSSTSRYDVPSRLLFWYSSDCPWRLYTDLLVSLQRFEYMLKTRHKECHWLFRFQLSITLLQGIAQIFEQYVYYKIGKRPEKNFRSMLPILECYLFGGPIGWYCTAMNKNEVFLSQVVMPFVLIVNRLGYHTRRSGTITILPFVQVPKDLPSSTLMLFSTNKIVGIMLCRQSSPEWVINIWQ